MRVRLLSLLSAAALLLLGAVPASATSEGHGYLALGDSVPFGYHPDPATWPHISVMVGYPEIVAKELNIEEVNASCPGEATGGFLSLTGTDNGCRAFRFAPLPLHVMYTTTQMDFAVAYLRSNPRTRLVTLMLGANDAFLLEDTCMAAHPGDLPAIAACVSQGSPSVLRTIAINLNTIFAKIRATGYHGLLIAVTYYVIDYADPTQRDGALALNAVIAAAASAHGALVASGFDAFAAASARFGGNSCAAGLLLPPFPLGSGCDEHPSARGHDVLAATVVNTIADSCPAANATGCLDRNRG